MKHLLLATVATAALSISSAQATLMLSANFGGTIFNCSDNQASCDTDPAVGSLQIANQSIGGVQVNGSIQTSTKTAGAPQILNTSSLSVINNNTTTTAIIVTIGDTDFNGPVNSFNTSGSGVFQQAVGSSATLNWFDDPNNAQGATSPTTTPGTMIDMFSKTATVVADSFSHNGSGPVNDPGLFSMTEQVVGSLIAGGQLLNRGQTEIKNPVVIPEPASLAILAIGLIGTWLVRRRYPRHS